MRVSRGHLDHMRVTEATAPSIFSRMRYEVSSALTAEGLFREAGA